MGKKDFDLDLVEGQEGEHLISDLLRGGFLVEVKRDQMVGSTGNVAIEIESRGAPSGLTTTKADWWAYILSGLYKDEVIVFVKTERLKRLVEGGRIIMGGDDFTSRLVLLPVTRLLKP